MQSLREKSVIFGCCIFINARPSPKNRANSRTESDILAPSQCLILHFMHGSDKNGTKEITE